MKNKLFYHFTLILFVFLLALASCKNSSVETDLGDSLSPVEEVYRVTGTDNTVITVNRDHIAYFRLNFSEIQPNDIIDNGTGEGWCIDWQKPINSNGGVYENIQLYSTYNVKPWKPINYLFNILDELKQSDPEITNLEIQLAIWTMRGNPEFHLDAVALADLPSRMHNNGEPAFSREKVDFILEIVESGYRDFDSSDGTRFAVIAETPSDVQTVITVVE